MLGTRLDKLADRGVLVLHDRRIPRTTANIDHIAVAPSGVFVIDAKRYSGRPQLHVEGGILRPRTERLMVGTCDRTRLVDGMHKQVELVMAALTAAGFADAPVHGMLCFVEADWPLIGGSFVIGGVDVLWPKKATERLLAPGALGPTTIAQVHRALAGAFRPA